MNPVIERPDGASTGQHLCHDHDVCWIRCLRNVKWTKGKEEQLHEEE